MGVQFEEQTYTSRRPQRSAEKVGAVSKLFMSLGLAKSKQQASVVGVIFIILLCLVSVFALQSTQTDDNTRIDPIDVIPQ